MAHATSNKMSIKSMWLVSNSELHIWQLYFRTYFFFKFWVTNMITWEMNIYTMPILMLIQHFSPPKMPERVVVIVVFNVTNIQEIHCRQSDIAFNAVIQFSIYFDHAIYIPGMLPWLLCTILHHYYYYFSIFAVFCVLVMVVVKFCYPVCSLYHSFACF